LTEHGHGWCSLRLRFDERELQLLRGAEQLRGAAMARSSGREELRAALQLAKAGQKVGRSVPGGTVSLEERELRQLLEALHFAAREVPAATRFDADAARRAAVFAAFPELAEMSWRSFAVARELDEEATRLAAALGGEARGERI
jgi:hypothetical protein